MSHIPTLWGWWNSETRHTVSWFIIVCTIYVFFLFCWLYPAHVPYGFLCLRTKTIESLSENLFNPLELNTDDIYSPLCDVDPDANYFNELNAHIYQNCNYYYEHSFSAIIQTRFKHMIDHNVFSLCHINIRSMKANLTSFEICLQNLEFEFSVIGITETWLTDSNSDLYTTGQKFGIFGKHNGISRIWHLNLLQMAWHQPQIKMVTIM